MFNAQITAIESQRSLILAQIETLASQEQALVAESLQYQEMTTEATVLLGSITSLKNKFSIYEDATSVLFAEISKIFQAPATTADLQPEKIKNEEQLPVLDEKINATTTLDDEHFAIIDAIEAMPQYLTAVEIEAALADEAEVDTHLMKIANVLDSCPPNEIPGRVWFYVQNTPVDFDSRILGYLPKSIRTEWEKQRSVQQNDVTISTDEASPSIDEITEHTTSETALEATSSTILDSESAPSATGNDLVSTSSMEAQTPTQQEKTIQQNDVTISTDENTLQESKPEVDHFFEIGDLVEIPEGKVGHITEIEYDNRTGQRIASIVCPGGTYYHPTSELKYIGKYQAPQTNFEVDDLVQLPDGRTCRVNKVAAVDGSQLVDVTLPDDSTGAYKAVSLTKVGKYQEPPSEPAKTATKGKKTKKSKTNPADILKCQTYAEIRDLANKDPQLIKEAAVSAKTKAEKELIERLPEMIRDYMYGTRDFSDLDWLPSYVVQRVRCLFSEPGSSTAA